MRYLVENFDHVLDLARTHLYLALVPLVIGLLIAVPLGAAIRHVRWLRRGTLVAASIAFTIPSLALFVILPPLLGISVLDPLNVVVALTIYSTALLVRAVLEALDAVPVDVVDSAIAMGFTKVRRTVGVEVPLATPVLMAHIRVVAVTNISLVSIGSVIGIGGLGQLFTQGYQRDYPQEIIAGIIAIVTLALAVDLLLFLAGRVLTPWTRADRGGRALVARAVGRR